MALETDGAVDEDSGASGVVWPRVVRPVAARHAANVAAVKR
jgi:hypothetical protein